MINSKSIAHYFKLARIVNKCDQRIRELRKAFFSQTMSSYITSNGLEIFSKGFNVEYHVSSLVDYQRRMEKYTEICKFKSKHFNEYLNTLQPDERKYLKKRYMYDPWPEDGCEELHPNEENEWVDKHCLEMISEIEEAVSYRFLGKKPYIDDDSDIDQVSEEEFEEAFDNAFLTMINRLGG